MVDTQRIRQITASLVMGFLALSGVEAAAQDVTQILDRVDVFSGDSVLQMEFDDPNRFTDFAVNISEPGARFSACKLTAGSGLWCLDGKTLVNWPSPSDPGTSYDVLSCEDPVLGLDSRKANTCTGMTVDSSGAIYLAGKNKGKAHNLIKLVKKDTGGACPTDFVALAQSPDYCASLLASGRPLLVDINPIDGDAADEFNPGCTTCSGSGKGTLGLEERKSAVFFPDAGAPVEIASGKSDWNLIGNEQLLSTMLLQLPNAFGGLDSLVLVTTTKGRILAVETDGTPDPLEVFNIEGQRDPASIQCAFDDQHYGIRTSLKSGTVYVTDRNYCEVLALHPVVDTNGQLLALANTQEGGADLTLSTVDGSGSYPPIGPTLAPGIVINLADCAINCTLVNDSNGVSAAILSNVSLIGSQSEMTLFQIQGIPDCRYVPNACIDLLEGINSKADLFSAGILADPTGTDTQAAQLLNATPLLPSEITDLFPEGLPNLWVSRWYRGQEGNGYLFDAIFGFTDATFTDVYELELNVAELTGRSELGCAVNMPNNTDVSILRNWDVAIKVSEKFISIDRADIPDASVHETTLINTGCGSSRTSGERFSLLPVNMEIAPNTWDGLSGAVVNNDDAVFAKLILSLFDDLRASIDQLACNAVDGDQQTFAPLSISDCSTLDNQWLNTRDKLDKCIDATKEPKTSSRNEACQAFESQLANYAGDLDALTASGQDPANRIGEMRARLRAIDNLFYNLFFPSIPDAGFQDF